MMIFNDLMVRWQDDNDPRLALNELVSGDLALPSS